MDRITEASRENESRTSGMITGKNSLVPSQYRNSNMENQDNILPSIDS
jgi:hypothetical protein